MKLKYVNNDDQHAYYLDGKRAKGVTTVASIPDNRFNLERYGKRMVAIGLAMNPVLVEAVAAHFDDKNEVDGYVDDAYIAAKAAQGADRGTAVHRFTERHDLGEPIIETPLASYVISSWKMALALADLEVLPEYVERIVVHPDRRICGRLDRVVRNKKTGVLYVADVKGGENAIRYPHSMACQVALYANAPLIAGPVPSSGGETTTFDPMPDVNKDIGYIFHLPESGEAAVATVDIAGGWDITTRAIFPILDWRDRRDLCQPVATIGGGEPAPVPTPSVEQARPAVDVGGGEPSSPPATATPADGTPSMDLGDMVRIVRRQELVEHIKRLPDVEREELAHRWPVGVPTFKQSDTHTDEQLDAIAAMIDNVDWSPRKPDYPEPEPEPELPPAARWVGPDEGASLDDETVEAIKATIATLDKVTLSQVNDWAAEAHAAHRPFSLSREDARTQRRFEIMRAAIALSPYEPDVQRAALGFVMGEEVQPAVTVGAALGSLTIGEASRLALLAESLGSTVSVVYDGRGVVAFHGDGLAAVAA